MAAGIEDEVVEERFTELFAANESVTNRNVLFAFQLFMSRHRVYRLLKRLTEEGRLIREGQGAQTRYRPAPGHFGREERGSELQTHGEAQGVRVDVNYELWTMNYGL